MAIALAALAPQPAAAAGAEAPLEAYPMAQPSPVGNSRPPLFLDEDETVRVNLNPDGGVRSVVDDAILRIRGQGDYVIFLPATVNQVANLGGDSPPGLQDQHVSFLGNVVGQSQLGVEATLDTSTTLKTLPLRFRLGFSAGGRPLDPGHLPQTHAPITVSLTIDNLTAASHTFQRGRAAPAPLASVLENLRQASVLYTPETDLQALLPLPPSLTLAAPTVVTQDSYVPLALTATVRLPTGATLVDPGGADVVADSRGSRLAWLKRLPSGPGGDGHLALSFTFSSAHPRVPGIEVKADPIPLPASVFTPPGGVPWASYLASINDTSDAALLAQAGAASIHRIGELAQPLGRPGPGPVKVKYDFVVESGTAVAPKPVGLRPVHPEPWAVLLAVILLAFGAGNAALLWSRH